MLPTELIARVSLNAKSTIIIGITGASGAGKSAFARQLYTRISSRKHPGAVAILNEDSYYRDQSHLSTEARSKTNYDHPDAFEHELLASHLTSLRNGQAIEAPQYDFSAHNRAPDIQPIEPTRILVLEGIMILHHDYLRDLMDLKLFVDVPMDICLSRRLRRDIVERGRTLDSVISQYEQTVRPMYFEFIDPCKTHADLIVPHGGENENALKVLENHLHRLLD